MDCIRIINLKIPGRHGVYEFENLIISPGPWIERFWKLMDQDDYVNINGSKKVMWTYNMLEEGELEYELGKHTTNNKDEAPIVHVDTEATLISANTGDELILNSELLPDIF